MDSTLITLCFVGREYMEIRSRLQGIIWYSVLNYFDKGLTFIIPFLILKNFNEGIYSELEYLISITLVVSSFLDIGLKVYFFYGFRKKNDKETFLQSAKSLEFILIFIYAIIGIIVTILSGFDSFIFFCVVRILFLTFINLQASIYRIEDKPTNIFLFSSILSLCIIVIVMGCLVLNKPYNLLIYSIPYILFFLWIILKNLYLFFSSRVNILETICLGKEGIRYGWPFIFTTGIITLQNHFAKLYGYNSLSSQEFTTLAIIMRCFTIVFLMYSAVGAFYHKQIYMRGHGFLWDIYVKFQLAILCGIFLMFTFIFISNETNILPHIPYSKEFWIIFTTHIIVFNRAYIESFFGKYNKIFLLLFSIGISFVCFLIGIFMLSHFNILNLINLLLLLLLVEIVYATALVILYVYIIKPIEKYE